MIIITKSKIKKLLNFSIAIALTFLIISCSNNETKQKQSKETKATNTDVSKGQSGVKDSNAPPNALDLAISSYRFGHEHLDILDCPTDFCQKQRL